MFSEAALDHWHPESLREALLAAGYTSANFRPADRQGRILTASDDNPLLPLALRLFADGGTLARDEAGRLLGPAMDPLIKLGMLVEADEGSMRSTSRLEPDGNSWFASDHPMAIAGNPDHVMGIGRSTRMLAAIAPKTAGQRALDLCSGAGWIALNLAKSGCRVTAADVSRRALGYARFNARMAGQESLTFAEGNLLEPVGGQHFDLITANPPFVISPESTFTFRDSGQPGTTFCEKLARSLPDHLAMDGIAVMLLNWFDDGSDEQAEAPLDWVRDHPGGRWLFRTLTQDPAEYASLWLRDIRGGREPDPDALKRWIAHFENLGARRLHSGFLILHRNDGTRWSRSDVRAIEQLRTDAGQDLRLVAAGERWLENRKPTHSELLEHHYRLPDRLRTETVSQLDDDWNAIAIRLLSPGRLSYDGPVDAFLLRLLAHCRKGGSPADLLSEIGKDPQLPPADQLSERVALLVRELIRHGMMFPIEPA